MKDTKKSIGILIYVLVCTHIAAISLGVIAERFGVIKMPGAQKRELLRYVSANKYDNNLVTLYNSLPSDMQDGEVFGDTTILVFTDYDCPFCSMYYRDTLLKTDRFIRYVNLPLVDLHPESINKAIMVECTRLVGISTSEINKLYDILYQPENQSRKLSSTSDYKRWLQSQSNRISIEDCANGSSNLFYRAKQMIQKDLQFAKKHNIVSTPTLYYREFLFAGYHEQKTLMEILSIIDEE